MYAKKTGKGTYTSIFDSGIMVDSNSCPEPIVPKSWAGITLLGLDEVSKTIFFLSNIRRKLIFYKARNCKTTYN